MRAASIALVVAIGAALVVTSPASGQRAGVHRVEMLLSTFPAAASHVLEAFNDSLRERDWIPGENLLVESRWGEGSRPAGADRSPIAMVNVTDPVGAGLVATRDSPSPVGTGLAAVIV